MWTPQMPCSSGQKDSALLLGLLCVFSCQRRRRAAGGLHRNVGVPHLILQRGEEGRAEQHPSRLGFYGQKRLKPPCVFTTVGENEITSWRVSSPDGIKLGAPTLRPAPSPAETEQ